MNVFLTGATGFIGRHLVLRLQRDGHHVTAWSRSPERARDQLGAATAVVAVADDDDALQRAVDAADVVINLAGEPVMKGRWTDRRKQALWSSRVDLTERLAATIRRSTRPPAAFVSASAVGFYGDTGDTAVGEDAPAGDDFLARLCVAWEAAAMGAASATRVCIPRIGIVLGADGGALATMLPAFRLGLGGRLGDGQQYMPWVHVRDLVEVLAAAATDERFRGPINAVGPSPVRNRQFARALGDALHRPAVIPVPGAALRLVLGEAGGHVLVGQRAVPHRLEALGFDFRYRDLDDALREIADDAPGVHIGPAGRDVPDRAYLQRRRPAYRLFQQTVVDAPLEEVFPFFAQAENLGALTPPSLDFRIENERPIAMAEGTRIAYTIKLGPVPMKWRTVIDQWRPGDMFVDSQVSGPYRCWWHRHTFRADGAQTVMTDEVLYAPPLGWLGRIAHRLFVARMLRRIFGFRHKQIALRFGRSEHADARQAA